MSNLPPMPEASFIWSSRPLAVYTEEQMREYASKAVAAEREACALECARQIDRWTDDRARYAASECAATIYARGEKE